MDKAVMISIRPWWINLIARGAKTIEVRKSRPKLETPFKCYIYCTKAQNPVLVALQNLEDSPYVMTCGQQNKKYPVEDSTWARLMNGTVCGEFTCDSIIPITVFDNGSIKDWNYWALNKSCILYEDMADYIGHGKNGYGWCISDLKIYDEPKKLDSFIHPSTGCCNEGKCTGCKYLEPGNGYNLEDDCAADFDTDSYSPLRRPPQSWCYVEEI